MANTRRTGKASKTSNKRPAAGPGPASATPPAAAPDDSGGSARPLGRITTFKLYRDQLAALQDLARVRQRQRGEGRLDASEVLRDILDGKEKPLGAIVSAEEDLAEQIETFAAYVDGPGVWDEAWGQSEPQLRAWADAIRALDESRSSWATPRIPRCGRCHAWLHRSDVLAGQIDGSDPGLSECLASFAGRALLLGRLRMVAAQLAGFCSTQCRGD